MSTTTKHTPGPWYVRGAPGTFQHEQPRDITSGPTLIATACMVNNMRGETLANARLIAAAPDLLEALEAIAEACEANADSAMGEGWVKAHEKFGACARAAIAKATGRSV